MAAAALACTPSMQLRSPVAAARRAERARRRGFVRRQCSARAALCGGAPGALAAARGRRPAISAWRTAALAPPSPHGAWTNGIIDLVFEKDPWAAAPAGSGRQPWKPCTPPSRGGPPLLAAPGASPPAASSHAAASPPSSSTSASPRDALIFIGSIGNALQFAAGMGFGPLCAPQAQPCHRHATVACQTDGAEDERFPPPPSCGASVAPEVVGAAVHEGDCDDHVEGSRTDAAEAHLAPPPASGAPDAPDQSRADDETVSSALLDESADALSDETKAMFEEMFNEVRIEHKAMIEEMRENNCLKGSDPSTGPAHRV
jgi:hypothetical protein